MFNALLIGTSFRKLVRGKIRQCAVAVQETNVVVPSGNSSPMRGPEKERKEQYQGLE